MEGMAYTMEKLVGHFQNGWMSNWACQGYRELQCLTSLNTWYLDRVVDDKIGEEEPRAEKETLLNEPDMFK